MYFNEELIKNIMFTFNQGLDENKGKLGCRYICRKVIKQKAIDIYNILEISFRMSEENSAIAARNFKYLHEPER